MPSEERPLKKLKREKSPGNPGKLKKLKSSSRRKRDDSSDSSDASRPREHVAAERAFTKVAMDAVVELKSQIERGTIAKRETDLEDPHKENATMLSKEVNLQKPGCFKASICIQQGDDNSYFVLLGNKKVIVESQDGSDISYENAEVVSDINAEFLNQTVIIGAEKKNGKWKWPYEGKCVSNSVPLIKYKSAVKENGFLESGHVWITRITKAAPTDQPLKPVKFLAGYLVNCDGTRLYPHGITDQKALYVHSGCIILKSAAIASNKEEN